MADWKLYKGEGPWAFVKGPDKNTYNEGESISSVTNPIWKMTNSPFGAAPVTPTHIPCGYWHTSPAAPVDYTVTFRANSPHDVGYWVAHYAYIDTASYPSAVWAGTYGGWPSHTWCRFQSVNIPKGAEIISASLSLTPFTNESGTPCNLLCYTNTADNPSYPVTVGAAEALALSSSVQWNGVPYYTATRVNTPSLVTPLQEIVNRLNWASGNSVMFVIRNNPATGVGLRSFRPHAAGFDYAPMLIVRYI